MPFLSFQTEVEPILTDGTLVDVHFSISENVPVELTTSVKTVSIETSVSIEEKGYVTANFSMKEFLAENNVTADKDFCH